MKRMNILLMAAMLLLGASCTSDEFTDIRPEDTEFTAYDGFLTDDEEDERDILPGVN